MGAPSRKPESPDVYNMARLCRDCGLTPEFVKREVRAGLFPKPANWTRGPRMWRWHRRQIVAQLSGERFATVDHSQVAS